MRWALKTPEFHNVDEFVIQNKNNCKWLKELHAEIRLPLNKPIAHQPYLIKKRFGNWRDTVVDWYNSFAIKGFRQAKMHLYLNGPPDTGKTHFVQYLLGNFIFILKRLIVKINFNFFKNFLEPYKKQIFYPSEIGRFFLEGFNKSLSTVIVMEQADMNFFCTQKWKELVSEELVLIESKYEDTYPEVLHSPIIFISNCPPQNSEYLNTKINKILNRQTRVEIVNCLNENGMNI